MLLNGNSTSWQVISQSLIHLSKSLSATNTEAKPPTMFQGTNSTRSPTVSAQGSRNLPPVHQPSVEQVQKICAEPNSAQKYQLRA